MNAKIILGIFQNPVTMNYSQEDATIEILIMLFIAALLGFLLRHILGYTRKKEIILESSSNKRNSMTGDLKLITNENTKLKMEIERLKGGNKTKMASTSNKTSDKNTKTQKGEKKNKKTPPKSNVKQGGNKKDNLKVVEGIGPAIEKLLNNNNIFTFTELANANLDNLKKILEDAGPRFRVHVPETWTDQATLLKDGKMKEFKVLTEKLKGGRKV